jgi:mevalonate kinase
MNRFVDFRAHGKLLLTGEYLVLEGAQALAIPLKLGQSLQARPLEQSILTWEARCPQGLWFSATFQLPTLVLQSSSDDLLSHKLKEILSEAFSETKKSVNKGVQVITTLDFHPEYGFGSSATLISLLSQWLELNAHGLHHALFGGSGYDIACATANGPVLYSLKNKEPQEMPVHFYPDFHHQLYFVYLGQKQRSAEEVARFKKHTSFSPSHIDKITALTHEILLASSLGSMENILKEHEQLMSDILQRPTIQSDRFKNYEGVVKSLGAWGGDFVLVTTQKKEVEFRKEMKKRGFEVVYSFEQLVMH